MVISAIYSMVIDQCVVAKGVGFPLFPMRPVEGLRLTSIERVNNVLDSMANGDVVQRKLNGDRAVLLVKDGRISVINRYCSTFSHPILNRDAFLAIPSGSVIDGEVYQRKFLPFEVLAIGGESLTKLGPKEREDEARRVCRLSQVDFIFGDITRAWLSNFGANAPMWEGVVVKQNGSPYVPLGSSGQESKTWKKLKWD